MNKITELNPVLKFINLFLKPLTPELSFGIWVCYAGLEKSQQQYAMRKIVTNSLVIYSSEVKDHKILIQDCRINISIIWQ